MTGQALYSGSCHCGRINIKIAYLPDTLTECNCSICRRYQAAWAYFERREVTLEIAQTAAKPYSWNDGVIEFMHCDVCGCLTHYQDVKKTPESRLAVNMRMFSPEVWQSLPVRMFDGADTWQVTGIKTDGSVTLIPGKERGDTRPED